MHPHPAGFVIYGCVCTLQDSTARSVSKETFGVGLNPTFARQNPNIGEKHWPNSPQSQEDREKREESGTISKVIVNPTNNMGTPTFPISSLQSCKSVSVSLSLRIPLSACWVFTCFVVARSMRSTCVQRCAASRWEGHVGCMFNYVCSVCVICVIFHISSKPSPLLALVIKLFSREVYYGLFTSTAPRLHIP